MRGTTLTIALFALTAFSGCKRVTYFACGDGYEVPLGVVCDGYRDCYNGADEDRCWLHWVCGSGELINPFYLCDGTEDCLDGSDERFHDRGGPCDYDEAEVIACGAGGVLDLDYVCDGVRDCPGNADEIDCTRGDTYLCDDNIYAVYVEELCDDIEQCPDGSDERYCVH